MFCPNCRTEHEEGVTICVDCGAALVAELPGKAQKWRTPESQASPQVTVLTSLSLPHLEVAKSVLEGAGVKYTVKNEMLEAYPITGFAEIQVSRDDAEYALELLAGLADYESGGDF